MTDTTPTVRRVLEARDNLEREYRAAYPEPDAAAEQALTRAEQTLSTETKRLQARLLKLHGIASAGDSDAYAAASALSDEMEAAEIPLR